MTTADQWKKLADDLKDVVDNTSVTFLEFAEALKKKKDKEHGPSERR